MKTFGSWFCILLLSQHVRGAENLIANSGFEQRLGAGLVGFVLSGGAEYSCLGDTRRDYSSMGIALSSAQPTGSVSCIVSGLKQSTGKWFRFEFRGLPQDNFAVNDNNLFMRIEFFGPDGKISYDAKEKRIYEQVQSLRRDLTVNGARHQHGAEAWRNFMVDFHLPFPQIDQVKLMIGFDEGATAQKSNNSFLVDDVSLTCIPDPTGVPTPSARPTAVAPANTLVPLGGRWFYAAKEGESEVPPEFNSSNVDRLLYHDSVYSAPFAGNTTAWLRAGDKSADGQVVTHDKLIADNVTIRFESGEMVIRTHGIPNHPTGRFPEMGFGNPNYITERMRNFYIPLAPVENPKHFVTDLHNANHALPMGPIGLAVNGVVFFNPFDMGNVDATDMMDRCCGHPNQDGQYHYHKYPICVNSPWADDGKAHSPLLGWAFDGYPLYGPYESTDVMAKDLQGDHALNEFNMHYDAERGWHYHVTPGKFPYLIGGYWGARDRKDAELRPPSGGRGERRGPGVPPPLN